jgi:hypothetical protein
MPILKKYNIIDVFSTPIIKVKFKYHKKYKFKNIESKERYPGHWKIPLNTTFPDIIESDDFIDLKSVDCLKKDIKKCIDKVFKNLDLPLDYNFYNFWYNIYHISHGQEPHNHLPQDGLRLKKVYWSGIYYAKNATPTSFFTPNTFGDPFNFIGAKESKLKKYFTHEISVEVNDGDIILFPAYLMHSVPKVKKEKSMRLTFSFNLELN